MARPRLQHISLVIPQGRQDTVRAFYGELLGLEEKQPPKSLAHFQVVWFIVGDGEMELHFSSEGTPPDGTDRHHICLVVDDLAAYRKRLIEAGVTLEEAAPIPYRPRFFLRDPFGNLVELTTIQGDYRLAE
jgi:catechol 2,3-dioxygenase-like lactoylglutathione lyase family enzyme